MSDVDEDDYEEELWRVYDKLDEIEPEFCRWREREMIREKAGCPTWVTPLQIAFNPALDGNYPYGVEITVTSASAEIRVPPPPPPPADVAPPEKTVGAVPFLAFAAEESSNFNCPNWLQLAPPAADVAATAELDVSAGTAVPDDGSSSSNNDGKTAADDG